MKFFIEVGAEIPENIDSFPIEGIVSSSHIETNLILLQIQKDGIYSNGELVGRVFSITTPEDMDRLMNYDYSEEKYVLIETGDWHVIPLENLIAKFNTMDVELIATASNPQHVKLLQNILELGVDICLLKISSQFTLDDFKPVLTTSAEKIRLQEAKICHIERLGIGDRVCVDTVSLLKDGEGLLVGSTAGSMALVQAEVAESGFVNARPFRVNAGVVSSYTLVGEKSRYLSEIQAGKQVMIVDRDGNTRKEYVARIKIEKRPLFLIRFSVSDKEFPVILQDAETVKIMTKTKSIRVDKLKIGDQILVHQNISGRHFGMAVSEFIEEK